MQLLTQEQLSSVDQDQLYPACSIKFQARKPVQAISKGITPIVRFVSYSLPKTALLIVFFFFLFGKLAIHL